MSAEHVEDRLEVKNMNLYTDRYVKYVLEIGYDMSGNKHVAEFDVIGFANCDLYEVDNLDDTKEFMCSEICPVIVIDDSDWDRVVVFHQLLSNDFGKILYSKIKKGMNQRLYKVRDMVDEDNEEKEVKILKEELKEEKVEDKDIVCMKEVEGNGWWR